MARFTFRQCAKEAAMLEIKLDLTALEPLVLTDGSAEGMAHQTLAYIPGNMLLGALASRWIKAHPGVCPDDDPQFQLLFLSGEVSFGHAYPLAEKTATVPIPESYRRIKNRPDLPKIGAEGGDYFVCNSIRLDPESSREIFGDDEHPKLKRMSAGFMDPSTLRKPDLQQVWNVHVALGRQRFSIEKQLFGFSALAAGTKFQATVLCKSGDAAAALEKLLSRDSRLRLGHSRSAGYGLASCRSANAAEFSPPQVRGQKMVFFLLSQYLPWPAWETPLPNLLAAIEKLAGAKPIASDIRGSYCTIQGFNSLWNKPRAGRCGLSPGSVLVLEYDREISLPEFLNLGADQREGYGRILVNPPFLAKARPEIAPFASSPVSSAALPECGLTPGLVLVRERALKDMAGQQAISWLDNAEWKKFLVSVRNLDRPTRSQRNNLRDLTPDQFRAMLAKTPGEQWREALCYCPFTKRRETLADCVSILLDQAAFNKEFPAIKPVLPGGALSEAEQKLYASRSHRLFILHLLAMWTKTGRNRS